MAGLDDFSLDELEKLDLTQFDQGQLRQLHTHIQGRKATLAGGSEAPVATAAPQRQPLTPPSEYISSNSLERFNPAGPATFGQMDDGTGGVIANVKAGRYSYALQDAAGYGVDMIRQMVAPITGAVAGGAAGSAVPVVGSIAGGVAGSLAGGAIGETQEIRREEQLRAATEGSGEKPRGFLDIAKAEPGRVAGRMASAGVFNAIPVGVSGYLGKKTLAVIAEKGMGATAKRFIRRQIATELGVDGGTGLADSLIRAHLEGEDLLSPETWKNAFVNAGVNVALSGVGALKTRAEYNRHGDAMPEVVGDTATPTAGFEDFDEAPTETIVNPKLREKLVAPERPAEAPTQTLPETPITPAPDAIDQERISAQPRPDFIQTGEENAVSRTRSDGGSVGRTALGEEAGAQGTLSSAVDETATKPGIRDVVAREESGLPLENQITKPPQVPPGADASADAPAPVRAIAETPSATPTRRGDAVADEGAAQQPPDPPNTEESVRATNRPPRGKGFDGTIADAAWRRALNDIEPMTSVSRTKTATRMRRAVERGLVDKAYDRAVKDNGRAMDKLRPLSADQRVALTLRTYKVDGDLEALKDRSRGLSDAEYATVEPAIEALRGELTILTEAGIRNNSAAGSSLQSTQAEAGPIERYSEEDYLRDYKKAKGAELTPREKSVVKSDMKRLADAGHKFKQKQKAKVRKDAHRELERARKSGQRLKPEEEKSLFQKVRDLFDADCLIE